MNEHQWKAVNQVAQRWKIVSFLAGLITIATYLHTWLHYGDWAIGGGGQIEPAWHSAVCGVRPSKFSRGSPAGTGGSSVGATMVTTQGVY